MENSNSSECLLEEYQKFHDAKELSVLEVDVTPFLIDTCDKAFSSNIELNENNQLCTQKSQFVCDLCKLNFDDKTSFDCHRSQHKQNLFICDCGMTFIRKSSLAEHQKLHKAEKFFCNLCKKGFAVKSLLKSHKLTHTKEKSYVCQICGRGFPKEYGFLRHYRVCEKSNHKSDLKDSFNSKDGKTANTCDGEFSDKISVDTLYLSRMSKIDKPFNCYFCKESFSCSRHLTIHYRSYPSHKPFTCDICKKSFMQKTFLIRHYRFHTKEKPFVCDICDKGFYEKRDMQHHSHYAHSK